jgi:hypothetical protein
MDFEAFEGIQTDILSWASKSTVLIDPGDFLTFEMSASYWNSTPNGNPSLLLEDASLITGSLIVNFYDQFPRGVHYLRLHDLVLPPVSRQTLQFEVTISPGIIIIPSMTLCMRMRNTVYRFGSDGTYNANSSSEESSSSGFEDDSDV